MKTVVLFLIMTLAVSATPIIDIPDDSLRFGYVSVGGQHVRDVRVANIGDQLLIINDVDLRYVIFHLLSPSLPDTIGPMDFKIYSIAFNPTVLDGYIYDFVFSSNDPVSPIAILPFTANAAEIYEPGQIIWTFQAIENVVCCTAVDDINGDGFRDVLAESFDAGASGDNLTCHSGSGIVLPELLWSARPLGGPSNSGGYGDQCLVQVDDLNRSGSKDIILGTAWGSRTVFAIEGITGETIWAYDTYQNLPSGWIYSVASIGDINGDTIPEIIAGAGSDANAAYCFDGATGDRIWLKQADDVIYSVCRLDDVNDDGIPDVVLGGGDNEDRVYCISGASQGNATNIWSYSTDGSVMSVDKITDVDDDGFDDVIAGTWNNGNRVFALSGHSANIPDVIWNVPTPSPIMKVVVCPDLNGDGYQDILVASWASFALALSGHTGAELWRNYFADDVWAIHWAFDTNADGICEVVAGSFTGEVRLINGSDGETIWTAPTNAKIFTVRPIEDINGDNFPDIIAGQQFLNNVGGQLFVISGGTVNSDAADEISPNLPVDQALLKNYPNPFNASTMISFNVSEAAMAKIQIYDMLGKNIKVLMEGLVKAGNYTAVWDGRDTDGNPVASGIYFARLQTGEISKTAKMVLLK